MNNLFKVGVFLLASIFIGCGDDDSPTPEENNPDTNNPDTIDLSKAILDDFKFSEVNYVDIEITQPEIVDGSEKTGGKILITLPSSSDNLNLSLSAVNFDTSKFKISPEIGAVQLFEEGKEITYTITSILDPEQSIHYQVSIVKEDAPVEVEEPVVTAFKFERSKNPDLASDVVATIVDYPNSHAIYAIVPVGTDITSLIPTVDFTGDQLQYKQGEGDFVAYPETDLNVDFTSDYNYLTYKDQNEFELMARKSESQIRYRVIVDVENPIELSESSVSTADIVEGDTRNFSFSFTNRGNHPIQAGLDADDYIDNTPDDKGNIYSASLEVASPLQGTYIRPGEEGNVFVRVNADGAAIGDYDVAIVFTPKYDLNRAMINDLIDDLNPIEDIFMPTRLNVTTKVIRTVN